MFDICRGGKGLPTHQQIVFEGSSQCPLCKTLTELAGFKEELEELKEKMAPELREDWREER